MISTRRALAAALVALLLAGAAPAALAARPAGGRSLQPFDYISQKSRLSKPVFHQTTRQAFNLEMADGETIYVEVVRPDPEAYGERKLPVILEASPYHGTLADRDGTRIFPDPVDEEGNLLGLTGYFAPRGYAVVMMDLRGTGRSTGCLDHLGQDDASDLKAVIEWAAGQPWSNGRVGMTGHSYVGSTPSVAAAQDPQGLVTIVPSAGLASMYDHQFNKGVPWLLQWVGPMYAYEALAMQRDMPPGSPPLPLAGGGTGDNWENAPNPQFGCGWQNSAAISGTGQVTGQYQGWHAERDWREGAATADIPIFMIHGVNDNAARIPAAEWYFQDRGFRPGDKVWIGQWDHGSTNGRCGDQLGFRALHPTCRFDQFAYALHAWFDKQLMGRNVKTGPPVEVFLNGENPIDVTKVVNPETLGAPVYATNAWRPAPATAGAFPDATVAGPQGTQGVFAFQPPAEGGSATFGTTAEAVVAAVGRGKVTFTSEPLAQDALFVGVPQLNLQASLTTGQITHLTATLFRERVTEQQNEEGETVTVVEREPMNFCAIQPQLRNGIDTVAPVVPGEVMDLPMQCFAMAHWVPAGQRLALEISTKTPHHASFGSTDRQITVFTGPEATGYTLPVVPTWTLYSDVPLWETYLEFPLGPAQPGMEADVLVPAPGAGTQVEPVTAASFEFASEEGFDNASLEVLATPTGAADLDLYLQRATAGGWETLTAGETGDLDKEVLAAGRLPAGDYRIVVHNWAGGPQLAHLQLTFRNGNGEPGAGTAGTGSEGTALLVSNGPFGGLLQP